MYKVLESEKTTPMVVADMIAIDENGNKKYEWHKYKRNKMVYNIILGACFMYRASVKENIGEYDTSLFLLDYDYWLRIIKAYGDVLRIPRILYKYRVHRESLSERRIIEVKKQLHLYRKSNLDLFLSLAEDIEDYLYLFYDVQLIDDLSDKEWEKFREKCNLIGYRETYKSDDRVVIYGAGKYGQKLKKLLPNVQFFIDADKEKE